MTRQPASRRRGAPGAAGLPDPKVIQKLVMIMCVQSSECICICILLHVHALSPSLHALVTASVCASGSAPGMHICMSLCMSGLQIGDRRGNGFD